MKDGEVFYVDATLQSFMNVTNHIKIVKFAMNGDMPLTLRNGWKLKTGWRKF